jgi:hypothetical protein
MTLALVTDPAAVLRATGLLRSFCAEDDDHVNAIMQAALDDPGEQTLMRTFGALVEIAGVLADTPSRTTAGDITSVLAAPPAAHVDITSVLAAVQHQIIGDGALGIHEPPAGDVPPTHRTKES